MFHPIKEETKVRRRREFRRAKVRQAVATLRRAREVRDRYKSGSGAWLVYDEIMRDAEKAVPHYFARRNGGQNHG